MCLQATKKAVNMLETLDKWIDEIPPTDQPQRFGNKAYRTWFARLEEVRCCLVSHEIISIIVSRASSLVWAIIGNNNNHVVIIIIIIINNNDNQGLH